MNRADFLNADSDAIIFCWTDILLFDLSCSLNAGGPLQLYFLLYYNEITRSFECSVLYMFSVIEIMQGFLH